MTNARTLITLLSFVTATTLGTGSVLAQDSSDPGVTFHYEPTVVVHDAFSHKIVRILRGDQVKRGDVNWDGKVDLADVSVLISRLYTGNIKETIVATAMCARVIDESDEYTNFTGPLAAAPGVLKFTTDIADVDGDGKVRLADLQMLVDAYNGKVELAPMKCDLSPIEG